MQPDIRWSSDRTLRIALADAPGPDAHALVLATVSSLLRRPPRGLIDITPAYTTVHVAFSPETPTRAAESDVREALGAPVRAPTVPTRIIEILVCYGGEFGPDLADLAAARGLTADEVVRRHAGATYAVHFLGFSPGFAYLYGLPEALATPRRATPRMKVPAGSVGIAGAQTGVYPHATPGGWNLIGRTPRAMFDAGRAEPSLLNVGDAVRFVSISPDEFGRGEARA